MQRPWKPRYNDGSYGQWNEGRNGIDVEFVGGPRSPDSNYWLDGSVCQKGVSWPAKGGSVTYSNLKFGPIGST